MAKSYRANRGSACQDQGGLSDCEESVRHKILWENAQRPYKAMGPSAVDEIAAIVPP